jgi:hypothetical protein
MKNHRIVSLYKVILFTWIIVLLLLTGCNKHDPDPGNKLTGNNNPIINADFEKEVDFDDEHSTWTKECWKADMAGFEWLEGEGHNGSNCISLSSEPTDNDVALTQDILLEGDKVFRLTAWIKTDNIVGGRGANNYKTFSSDSYENKICKGDTENAHDGIMYTIIRIKDKIGWEPFKKTFQYLYQTNTDLTSDWKKFNFFLDKLTEFSGKDVRKTYPDGELDIIKKSIDGQ